jgi:hypothetical protein
MSDGIQVSAIVPAKAIASATSAQRPHDAGDDHGDDDRRHRREQVVHEGGDLAEAVDVPAVHRP